MLGRLQRVGTSVVRLRPGTEVRVAEAGMKCSSRFRVQGVFWLPAREDDQLVGALSWEPNDGATLDLVGLFDGIEDPGNCVLPIVHGVAEGERFTLTDCHGSAFKLQVPGTISHQVRAFGPCLVGVLHPDPTGAHFDRAVLSLDFLAELSGRCDVFTHLSAMGDAVVDHVAVEFERTRDLVAELPHETVRLSSEWQAAGGHVGHAELEQNVAFCVDRRQSTSLAALIDAYLPSLRGLVTFFAQAPSVVRSIRVAGPSTSQVLPSGRVLKQCAEVLIPVLPGDQPSEPRTPRHTLIKFPTDTRGFRRLVKEWFELNEDMRAVLDLHFAPSYAGFMYGEHRFLTSAQELEAFHRRRLTVPPDAAEVEAREAALAACPAEHRPWLAQKLEFALEPSLRQRLRETLDFVGPGVADLRGRRRSNFINAVVTARNDLTHYASDARRSRRVEATNLFALATVLHAVMTAALLRCLGWSREDIQETATTNQWFEWAGKQFNG